MTVGGRILITSKRPAESLTFRKPIKGCYCNHEPKKIQYRSTRTVHQSNWPCDYCKSNFEFCIPLAKYNEQNDLSPTLSCKTLQKVQRINYTPRSKFLRRVQKKVSHHYNICGNSRSEPATTSHVNENIDCSDSQNTDSTTNKSNELDYRRCIRETDVLSNSKEKNLPKTLRISESNSDFALLSNACPCESSRRISGTRDKTNRSKSKNREVTSPCDVSITKGPCIQTIFPSCNRSKSRISPRKTITSDKQLTNIPTNEIPSKSSLKNKKKSCVLSQKGSYCMDCCSVKEKNKNSANTSKKFDCNNLRKCSHCLSQLCPMFISHDNFIDQEVVDVQKFREKNYYDTHGSRHTLLSTPQSSPEMLEQFQLNERLFPESIGKIHRDDLVVSMPICATKQLKRIHYFPRYIVKQQKNPVTQTCYSKKGHQSCPLTGHAIDLGALKIPCPINSLALKFQKGVA